MNMSCLAWTLPHKIREHPSNLFRCVRSILVNIFVCCVTMRVGPFHICNSFQLVELTGIVCSISNCQNKVYDVQVWNGSLPGNQPSVKLYADVYSVSCWPSLYGVCAVSVILHVKLLAVWIKLVRWHHGMGRVLYMHVSLEGTPYPLLSYMYLL